MSPIAITLLLLVVAVILFATEKIPVDVVGILLVIGLIMTQVLTVQEGLSGFGDNIIIIIGGLFVLTGGLVKTGIVDLIGRRLYRVAGNNEFLLTAKLVEVPMSVQLPPKIAPNASGIKSFDGGTLARFAKPRTTGTNIAVVVVFFKTAAHAAATTIIKAVSKNSLLPATR